MSFLEKPKLWFAAAAVLAFSLAAHPVLFTDSMGYADISHHIADGFGPATMRLHLSSMTVPDRALLWPPLYPLVLAAVLKLGFDVVAAAGAVLVVSLLVAMWVVYALGKRFFSERAGVFFAAAWLCANAHSSAWSGPLSEPLFIALFALALFVCTVCLDDGRAPRAFFFALGLLCGAATLTRYLGFSCLLAAVASLAWRRRLNVRDAAGLAAGFVAVLLPWLAYCLTEGISLLLLARPASENTPLEAVGAASFLMLRDNLALAFILFALISTGIRPAGRPRWSASVAPVFFFVFYTVCLVALASTIRFDRLNSRLCAPAYAALVTLLAGPFVPRWNALPSWVRNAALLAMLLFVFARSTFLWTRPVHHPHEANTPLYHWIKDNTPPDALIVKDRAPDIRFHTGRATLDASYPEFSRLEPEALVRFLERFERRFERVYLVWPAQELPDSYARLGFRHMARVETTNAAYDVFLL